MAGDNIKSNSTNSFIIFSDSDLHIFIASFSDETGSLTDVAKMMMPSGGMKQSTWLDYRNFTSLLGGVVGLVEVGVVDFKSYGDFEEIL